MAPPCCGARSSSPAGTTSHPATCDSRPPSRYAGRTILRHDLAIGPRANGWHAMLGRVAGTLLLVGPHAPGRAELITNSAALLPLAHGNAALISATGPDARTVRKALDEDAANTPDS